MFQFSVFLAISAVCSAETRLSLRGNTDSGLNMNIWVDGLEHWEKRTLCAENGTNTMVCMGNGRSFEHMGKTFWTNTQVGDYWKFEAITWDIQINDTYGVEDWCGQVEPERLVCRKSHGTFRWNDILWGFDNKGSGVLEFIHEPER